MTIEVKPDELKVRMDKVSARYKEAESTLSHLWFEYAEGSLIWGVFSSRYRLMFRTEPNPVGEYLYRPVLEAPFEQRLTELQHLGTFIKNALAEADKLLKERGL